MWRLRHGLFGGVGSREVFGAAPYLVPYLLELARIARRPHRGLVMGLMVDIAVAEPYRDRFRDPAAGPEPDHAALARAAMVRHCAIIASVRGTGAAVAGEAVCTGSLCSVGRLSGWSVRSMPMSFCAILISGGAAGEH
ncbi:hypothetical protein [Nonomuraea jabiensis]|uniref:Uncharacterized protein n=1 Tax=Nonomuraea jabiensis TaxID=882448 RepID=A0A7W9LF64_9ACTN|nr:hypothetical protein [Nonomuraea jabiensis]MBB5781529.1 hypothetical protein [Nonomuraea jabiensis]